MKKKKYLPLYMDWMKVKKMPREGLCASLSGLADDLYLFRPTDDELKEFGVLSGFWGTDKEFQWYLDDGVFKRFNEFRQNVVLFLAAMNDEL